MTDALYSSGEYQAALLALLPRGRVWPRDLDALQADFMAGLAPTFNRHDQRAQNLLVDAFPATAVELLPEWEESLGLPDPCAGPAATIEQRQAQVVARLTDNGGQSAAHFIDFAAKLGFTITITYFAPFRIGHSRAGDPIYGESWIFAWQVNSPDVSLQPNAVLECELRARAPAHTYVLFNYGWAGQLDFSRDDGRNTAFLGVI